MPTEAGERTIQSALPLVSGQRPQGTPRGVQVTEGRAGVRNGHSCTHRQGTQSQAAFQSQGCVSKSGTRTAAITGARGTQPG